MRSHFLPVGLALVVFSSIILGALTGCSNSGNSLASDQESAYELQSTINEPSEPTAEDLSNPAIIKPADNAAAVFDGMEIVNVGGAVSTDAPTGFAVKYGGQDVEPAGTLPLQQTATSIRTENKALIPVGDNVLDMVGGNILLQDNNTVRGDIFPPLIIKDIDLTFSVNIGRPVKWTFPTEWKTHFTRQGRAFIAKDSFLHLFWDGRKSVPPSDGIVVATVSAYYRGSHVWTSTHHDTVIRQGSGGYCDVVGHNLIPFDAIKVVVNVANTK